MMSNEAEERLFDIGASDGEAMNETGANGGCQGDSELSGGHRTCHGPVHFAAAFNVAPVGEGGVAGGARIEVLVIAQDKFKDRHVGVCHGVPLPFL